MPVADMKKIHIIAMKKDKQGIIEHLQRLGAVEIAEYDNSQSRLFSVTDYSADIACLRAKYSRTSRALDILNAYSSEKTSIFAALQGKESKTVLEYEAFQMKCDPVLHTVENICEAEERVLRLQENIARLQEKKASLLPWTSLQVPLGFVGTVHTAAMIGCLPRGFADGELEDSITELGNDPGKFAFQIVSSGKDQTCLMIVSMKRDKNEMEALLAQMQFSPPPLTTDHVPRTEIKTLETLMKENQYQLLALREEISRMSAHKNEIRFFLDYLAIKIGTHETFEQLGESDHVFLLMGYIPAKEFAHVKCALEKIFQCAVQAYGVGDADDAPSLMENSRFSQPVESVVASYNYPRYKEIDPTKATSFFYYLMFGLMFSDACYGAILVLACGGLLLKFKEMKEATSRFLRLFFWCGVSTLSWGIVFSSYFGDVVDVFSSAFLGRRLSIPPLWFSPLEEPMRLLLFCLAIGIVHLTVGYGMNLYAALRARDVKSAVYDSLMPILFLFSLVTVFMGTEMFKGLSGFSVAISPLVANICLAVAGFCVVGILLTAGRDSKNWIKRLLKGLFGLYNVIAGWVSDILSYSRLLALGLATGVIGSVINTLAVMPGRGVFGFLIFLVIFVAGHAMNFGINILGSYVHSNRLAYVEFFGKFYEGGGRPFRPFDLNTKYYTFGEEN